MAEERSAWLGYRPSLPDSLPVIGPSPRYADVYLAFGHEHLGMTQGPLTGRVVADQRTKDITSSTESVSRAVVPPSPRSMVI